MKNAEIKVKNTKNPNHSGKDFLFGAPMGLVNVSEAKYLSERECRHSKEATTTGFE